MTLLNKITTTTTTTTTPQKHPIPYTLPKPTTPPSTPSLIHPIPAFPHTQQDLSLTTLSTTFFTTLSRKLKSAPHSISSPTFLTSHLIPFLTQVTLLVDPTKAPEPKTTQDPEKAAAFLVGVVGKHVGRDVLGLVVDGCLVFGLWVLLESVIVSQLVEFEVRGRVVSGLVERKRMDLLCLCLRCFGDFDGRDLCLVLKCFLDCDGGEKDGCFGLESVRKEWESEAVAAIERVGGGKGGREAAVMMMVAYDGFLDRELCLHFVLASGNVDDVVFAGAVRGLDAEEGLRLVRYLGKWLRKYERFPEARVESGVGFGGLKLWKWVPKVEDLVKCLGVVVDEAFSMLALHPEFHQEVKAIEAVVETLVSEGRVCCSIADLVEVLKPEVGAAA